MVDIKKVTQSVEQNLSNSYVPKAKMPTMPVSTEITDAIKKKEAEKTKKDIDKFADTVKKKFKFIDAIGIAPVQASKIIEDEYEIPKADTERGLIHIAVVIPETKFKEIPKVKAEILKIAKEANSKIWVHILTPIDFWNAGLDSKFDIFEAWGMAFPIHDPKNFLGSIRMCQVHKSLVLRKFEKYVTTYGMFGSLVRGEVKKESDVDVVVIIDDTDVKRMSRFELLEKLRGIIHSYISEAMAIAGTKVDFNVQVWLLTDFWERVKDAEPVAFTFIRDGIPLYDRGAFLPWKSLLRMGRIKPSPESVDMFMSTGDKLKDNVNKRIFDVLVHDIYWGVMHPTQGMLMLYGLAPQNVYDTSKSFRETFVVKEKLIEKKYADIFDEIVIKYYKGFEHGKVKVGDISGTDVDRLFKNSIDYIARLKELRGQIEKRVKENDIQEIYENLFEMLKALLKKKGEAKLLEEFEESFVKTGKFPKRFLQDLKFIVKVKKQITTKKAAKKTTNKTVKKAKKESAAKESGHLRRDVDNARKKAAQITNALTEYAQRSDFLAMDRSRFIIKGKNLTAEVFFLENTYVVHGNKIQKIVKGKFHDASAQDLEKEILAQKDREHKIDVKALDVLKKEYKDFELVY
jgi:predicted nucleotidyltransferase